MAIKNRMATGLGRALTGKPILRAKEGYTGLRHNVILQEIVKDKHYQVYTINLSGYPPHPAYFETSLTAEGSEEYCLGVMHGAYGDTEKLTGYNAKYFEEIEYGLYDKRQINFKD